MATSKPVYDKKQQDAITVEADAAAQKALAAVAKKYPGVIIGHQVALTFPSTPIIVSHTGMTRPLAARDVAVPSPDDLPTGK